eukprot:scaffold336353_cov20-Prasinocladus_malaysianus.AAC.2
MIAKSPIAPTIYWGIAAGVEHGCWKNGRHARIWWSAVLREDEDYSCHMVYVDLELSTILSAED